MIVQPGSTGAAVSQIEQRLIELGLYTGSVDGVYGGGVRSAVLSFQRSNGLSADGIVGPATWDALFANQSQSPISLLSAPLAGRCLALTGTFETSTPPPLCFSALAGDFDRMGISFGALQWNLGQGSLQPLLEDMLALHPSVIGSIFQDDLPTLTNTLALAIPDQLAWARSIQSESFHLNEPWNGMFRALGRTPEFQAIETAHVAKTSAVAGELCARYQLTTERAHALMFDIVTQNGSIPDAVEAQILSDYAAIPDGDPAAVEVARLRVIANRRAEAARPQYVEEVRTRKLCIANGGGTVHGLHYQLEEQFGIGLIPAA